MSTDRIDDAAVQQKPEEKTDDAAANNGRAKRRFDWKRMLDNNRHGRARPAGGSGDNSDNEHSETTRPEKWSMGVLNDTETEEVPGSVLLLSKVSKYNEPLGLRNAPAPTSSSFLPVTYPPPSPAGSIHIRRPSIQEKKRTPDGKFVLDPQPDDSVNDPLNWKPWRRDAALFSLGFYCMLGGGMTPILAAGFNNVAHDFDIPEARVALTTGLYMLGLGLGSVLLSPTAILYGKRPVYLVAAICFIVSAIWCAVSPNFASLVCARVFMGFAVSSVECLPSATIAEIYFLHEKGYRLGIYTLLLLGGKNLVPLVSAAIIESLGWRWVFWIVATVVGFGLVLLFLFVPETFWDRTPIPSKPRRLHLHLHLSASHILRPFSMSHPPSPHPDRRSHRASINDDNTKPPVDDVHTEKDAGRHAQFQTTESDDEPDKKSNADEMRQDSRSPKNEAFRDDSVQQQSNPPDYFNNRSIEPSALEALKPGSSDAISHVPRVSSTHSEEHDPRNAYTRGLVSLPKQSWLQQLKPYSGRMSHDKWIRVATRPFILFAYPSLLWSALVYSLSVGWLIVLSESVTAIYKSRDTYNFSSLQAGLVYISPFVGGVLGTAVAGKFSDLLVRWLARKNGGLYEPEFRLIMAIPITITTVIGLMGFGWSAQEHDAWIVPTVFFGLISFGCSLGSTTSITFAVDSYRQYAGEALVTLNFSKNVLHGLVWSLFFNKWLESDGSKDVFLAIGVIQLALLLTTIPMYVYGKRARMWTVRRNLMEKF
ncbi:MFS general substrate transporter [Lecanosticta acicola]|uniref:MFS general substrate transporter n=1 Tax=Lecanosticta acicola TaxID=111012 RepID=A0AAI8W262_9PEZI|nr:MFS general substrate transporter [Lecanosticta acicola]